MDESVKSLIRRMRSERCPTRVLDEVNRTLAGQRRRAGLTLRFGFGWGLVGVAVLALGAALLLRTASSPESSPAASESSRLAASRAAHEAYASLTSIGLALQEAANRSGTIIFQETLPVVRQGLETTKNAIKNQTKS